MRRAPLDSPEMTMVVDHGTNGRVKTVPISQFKAKCLAMLAEVQRSGEPLIVTRRGKPIARVSPERGPTRRDWFGYMKGTFRITGDIISPAVPREWWDMLRE